MSRGHGTYLLDGTLISSVSGHVEKVNRLVTARPIKCRYNPEIGDVVVGRITEVSGELICIFWLNLYR